MEEIARRFWISVQSSGEPKDEVRGTALVEDERDIQIIKKSAKLKYKR